MSSYVSLEQLVLSPKNVRQLVDESSTEFQEVLESVRQLGVRTPLVVESTGQSRGGKPEYAVVSGHHRMVAARMAGLDRVPVVKRKYEDDAEAIRDSCIENLVRKNMEPWEAANAVRMLLACVKDGVPRYASQEDVAKDLGVSPARVSAWMAVGALPGQVHDLVKTGKLSRKAMERVAQGVKGSALQERVATVVAQVGGTVPEQVEAVRWLKEEEANPLEGSVDEVVERVRSRPPKVGGGRLKDASKPSKTVEAPLVERVTPEAQEEVALLLEEAGRQDLLAKLWGLGVKDFAGLVEIRDQALGVLSQREKDAMPTAVHVPSVVAVESSLAVRVDGPSVVDAGVMVRVVVMVDGVEEEVVVERGGRLWRGIVDAWRKNRGRVASVADLPVVGVVGGGVVEESHGLVSEGVSVRD